MNCAVEVGSGAMTYIKIGSCIQKFISRIHRYTDSQTTR
jgi:Uri superfamily endonuclease